MRSLVYCVAVSAIQMIATCTILHAAVPLGPLEIQQRCLDYRTLIAKSGSVSFDLILEKFVGDEKTIRTCYESYFVPGNLRIDVASQRGRDEGLQDPARYVFQDEEKRYLWFPRPDLEGTIAPIEEFDTSQGGAVGHFVLFHPLWIGLGTNPEAQLHANPVTRIVNPKSHKTPWEGPEWVENSFGTIARIRCDASSAHVRGELIMEFNEDYGFSLVRAVARLFDEDGLVATEQSVTSKIEGYPFASESGEDVAWFPREVVRETYSHGLLTTRQTIVVNSAKFGAAPGAQTFSVEGLGLTEGAKISDRTRGNQETRLKWDGAEAVPIFGPTANREPAPEKRGSSYNGLIVVNGVALIVVGLVVLGRRIRRSVGPK